MFHNLDNEDVLNEILLDDTNSDILSAILSEIMGNDIVVNDVKENDFLFKSDGIRKKLVYARDNTNKKNLIIDFNIDDSSDVSYLKKNFFCLSKTYIGYNKLNTINNSNIIQINFDLNNDLEDNSIIGESTFKINNSISPCFSPTIYSVYMNNLSKLYEETSILFKYRHLAMLGADEERLNYLLEYDDYLIFKYKNLLMLMNHDSRFQYRMTNYKFLDMIYNDRIYNEVYIIAEKMLKRGIASKIIEDITGLSQNVISNLKEEF